jgi:hypothetical protein
VPRFVAATLGVVAYGMTVYRLDAESKGVYVTVGKQDRVYYSGAWDRKMAQAVGDALRDNGLFSDKGYSVRLSDDGARRAIVFTVKDGVWEQANSVLGYEVIGAGVSPILGGPPITVRLEDTAGVVRRSLTVGKATVGKNDEIFYFGSASSADATKLAEALTKAGFLRDRGVSLVLSKGSRTDIDFVLKDGYWNDPIYVSKLAEVVRSVAPSVGGLPVHMCLLSGGWEMKKELDVN